MRATILNRKVHYWASLVLVAPLLVVVTSGLLLQTKKHWTWVQPREQRGTGTEPVIELAQILASVSEVRDLGVTGWDDINRIDLRPGRGVAKVWLRNGWEVQVDLGTGRVLQTAYRRSDVVESIHDGSYFGGDWTKLGIFLPAGLGLLLLVLTGAWLLLAPILAGRRAAEARETRNAHPGRKAVSAVQVPE